MYQCNMWFSCDWLFLGLLLYTIEDRNCVLFTLTSPLQSAVHGILQVLKLAGMNEYACDKWISFGCIATMWVYLHISGEVFSWASVTCVSIWMGEEGTTRVRRFGRGGQAGARKQETAGNRCDCLSHPPCTLPAFKIGLHVSPSSWHFLNSLALSEHSYLETSSGLFLPFCGGGWGAGFMLPTDLFSFPFLDSQILLSKGRQNADWNNWFNNNLKACKMPSLLLTREYHISQVDTFYTLEKKKKNTIFSSLLINCPLGY